MRPIAAIFTLISCLLSSVALLAQSPPSAPSSSVPRLINISGVFRPADGQPLARTEMVTLAIYADERGGAPLWQETQAVEPDASGRYSLLLGATERDGIPLAVFASAEARWLGIAWARPGESEAARTRLTFVPYAVRAIDADTLGGRPASAYQLAGGPETPGKRAEPAGDPEPSPKAVLPGIVNTLAKYVNGADVGSSAVYEANGMVGVGTTSPADALHVRFNNSNGAFTGYAVQNLGGTTASYSGMLFYDQNGALGQFQGFNNATHEYRINNVASSSSSFNGTINFMTGSTSRFFVGTGGNIGIGTTLPTANLEVSNALSGSSLTNVFSTAYANSGGAGAFIGRHARGTSGAPTALLSGDNLAAFLGRGFGATTFGSGGGGMFVRAAENWTDSAQGTSLVFNVTPTGGTIPFTVMNVTPSGDIGIGTPNPQASVNVVRNGESLIEADAYGINGPSAGFFAAGARGTTLAPTAVQTGDLLGFFATGGHDGTGIAGPGGVIGMVAAEDWTATAHGGAVGILSTPLGTVNPVIYVGVLPNGNVGIDTPLDVNGIPTALDRLQVFGDIRVGTSGTNGCLKNVSGTGLVGTCSSDRRLKKNITPFDPVLDKVAALQPVHYFWRVHEFPDRHFGKDQASGLVAQDVEQVLPELVETDQDGFKAVNYSQLPLLSIQAIKELKSENDALKQHVAELEPLKQRVAELERLMKELLVTAGRR